MKDFIQTLIISVISFYCLFLYINYVDKGGWGKVGDFMRDVKQVMDIEKNEKNEKNKK